jgi:hypothetical protein
MDSWGLYKGQRIWLWSTAPIVRGGVACAELIFGYENSWFKFVHGRSIAEVITPCTLPDDARRIKDPSGRWSMEPKMLENIVISNDMPYPLLLFQDGTFATNNSGAENEFGPVIEMVSDWRWVFTGEDVALFSGDRR